MVVFIKKLHEVMNTCNFMLVLECKYSFSYTACFYLDMVMIIWS